MRSWPIYDEDEGDDPYVDHRSWWDHLTVRGEVVVAVALLIGLLLMMWGAGVLSTWLTGVEG